MALFIGMYWFELSPHDELRFPKCYYSPVQIQPTLICA